MTETPDYMQLMDRVAELENALADAIDWAETVAGRSDFEQSDTLQFCLWVLTQGEDGRGLPL